MNQTISRALSKYINDDQNDWDLFLDPILFAYRTSIQSSSKFTPFFLMYGRRARLPVEVSGEQSSDPSGNDHATDDTTTWYVSCNIYTYTYNCLYLFFLLYSHDFDSHVTKMLEFHSQVLTKAKNSWYRLIYYQIRRTFYSTIYAISSSAEPGRSSRYRTVSASRSCPTRTLSAAGPNPL